MSLIKVAYKVPRVELVQRFDATDIVGDAACSREQANPKLALASFGPGPLVRA